MYEVRSFRVNKTYLGHYPGNVNKKSLASDRFEFHVKGGAEDQIPRKTSWTEL